MWTEKDQKLYRKFKFTDFSEAMGFIMRVALVAERKNHHPTWKNTYAEVEIWLTTHDAGNKVTAKDTALAEAIDQLYGRD